MNADAAKMECPGMQVLRPHPTPSTKTFRWEPRPLKSASLRMTDSMIYVSSSVRMAVAMALAWWCMDSSLSASIITLASASVPL